jgi:hypothetical protein
MAIDPAQSFSNALGQGLGIMKSYRDEARDEEEMAFSRQLREKADKRLDVELGMREKELGMRTDEHSQQMKIGANTLRVNEEYWSPAQVEYRQQMQALELSTAKSTSEVATINAKYAERDKQMDLRYKGAQIGQIQAQTGAYNRSNRGGGSDGSGGGLSRENQAFMIYAAKRARGEVAPPSVTALIGRRQAQEAALVIGAPDFARALQDPFGEWRKDPKVLRKILPYAGLSIQKTEQKKGYKNSTVVGMDINPKNKNEFIITFSGVNAKTGKKETYTGRQDVDTFLGKGSGYASVFNQIANSNEAKADIAKQFIASQPVQAREIIESEISFVEQRMKNMKLQGKDTVKVRGGDVNTADYQKLANTYAALTENDPRYITEFLLKGLARQEQSRY